MVSVILAKNFLCDRILGTKKFDKYNLEPGPTRKAPPDLQLWPTAPLHLQHSHFMLQSAHFYARNSASMERIDQSHTQKVSGVTVSTDFIISRPSTSLWPGGWDRCHNACCALVFDYVLVIGRSEKIMSETYSQTAQKQNGSSFTKKWQFKSKARTLINSEMTITFPNEAYVVTWTCKAQLKETIQKQKIIERRFLRHYSHFMSCNSAGYREKRSHNCMIDLHWTWNHIALKYIWRL